MSIETDCVVEVDSTAWPSTYYGRNKRVDLEKFFLKVQQEQLEIEQAKDEQTSCTRRVRFSADPPQVHIYEAEYDTFERLISSIENSKDTWPSYARRPPHTLDLRPVKNHQYGVPLKIQPPIPERRPSSSSSLSTPPLSPSPWPSTLDDDVSSDEDDKQPSPILPVSPLPFSPATLTKKFTSVFTRKKRMSTLW